MGIVYLATLIVGGLTLLIQFVGVGDADGDGGHDVGGDAEAHVDADGGVDDHGGDHLDGPTVLATFLSLRFWTFALMAFGLTGTLLHQFELMNRGIVPFVALAMGFGSGAFASWTFRALARASTTSGAESDEAVGQVGKVLVPFSKDRRGKVRIQLRGQTLDYLATTEEAELEAGAEVLIEEMRGDSVHVSVAPAAFLPPKSD